VSVPRLCDTFTGDDPGKRPTYPHTSPALGAGGPFPKRGRAALVQTPPTSPSPPRSPFHKSFSAIVGPNGSGKSNVIDAMLFVFGKKASKLRLKKVSELIHNSAAHPNLQSAKVAVHFAEIIGEPEAPAPRCAPRPRTPRLQPRP